MIMIILIIAKITKMIIIVIIIKTIKIHERDWLSQAPIWALIAQCTRHACSWAELLNSSCHVRALMSCTSLSYPLFFNSFLNFVPLLINL